MKSDSSADGQNQATLSPPPLSAPPFTESNHRPSIVACRHVSQKSLLGHSIVPSVEAQFPSLRGLRSLPSRRLRNGRKTDRRIVLIILSSLPASGDSSCITMLNSKSWQAAETSDRNAPTSPSTSFNQPASRFELTRQPSTARLEATQDTGQSNETLGINNPTRFCDGRNVDLTLKLSRSTLDCI